jgi:hypothetical protein
LVCTLSAVMWLKVRDRESIDQSIIRSISGAPGAGVSGPMGALNKFAAPR